MATSKDGISLGMLGLVVSILIAVVGGTWVLRDKFDDLHTNIVVLQADMKQVKKSLKIPEDATAVIEPSSMIASIPVDDLPHTLPRIGTGAFP